MLQCYGEQQSAEEISKRNYHKATQKLERKVKSIEMLINECICTNKYKQGLLQHFKVLANQSKLTIK